MAKKLKARKLKIHPVIVFVLVLSFFLCAISFAYFIFYQGSTYPNININPNTKGWITHSGKNYTIKYPSMLQSSDDGMDNLLAGKETQFSIAKARSDNFDYENWYDLTIFESDNPNLLSPTDFIENYISKINRTSQDFARKPVINKINSTLKNFRLGELNGKSLTLGYEYDLEYIIVTKGNRVYTVVFTGDNGGKVSDKARDEIYQILSTFEFKN